MTDPTQPIVQFLEQVIAAFGLNARVALEDTADGYEVIKTLYERKIYPTADGVRNTIRLLGASNEKIRGLRAEDLIDDRTVRKLEQKGLFQTLSK